MWFELLLEAHLDYVGSGLGLLISFISFLLTLSLSVVVLVWQALSAQLQFQLNSHGHSLNPEMFYLHCSLETAKYLKCCQKYCQFA